MKLIKQANGKQTIKMSQVEWINMGKKAGWINKEAYSDTPHREIDRVEPALPQQAPVEEPQVPDEGLSTKITNGIMRASGGTAGVTFQEGKEFVLNLFLELNNNETPLNQVIEAIRRSEDAGVR